MSKKYFISLSIITAILLGITSVSAETFETQSPIYTDDIGRMHFLGKGGYSSVRPMQMGEAYSNAVNEAVNKHQAVESEASRRVNEMKKQAQEDFNDVEKEAYEFKKQTEEQVKNVKQEVKNVETDITNVIKERPATSTGSSFKSSYTSKKEGLDPSYHKGYSTNIPSAGVNNSKTIYTDDLGRLHFFGKANQIRE